MKNKGKILVRLGLAVIVMIAGCMALVLPNGFSKSQNPAHAFGSVTGGDGSTEAKAIICTIGDANTLNGSTAASQFRGHVAANLNKWVVYKLTENINLSSISNWTPIPVFGPNMTFDGGGKEIQNLKNTGTGTAQGFIANLQGTVKNVKFTNVSMTGSGNLRGVVAATVARTATTGTINALIEDVHVTGGTVTGVRAGGLVGAVGVTAANGNGNQNDARLVNLTIKDSSNNASVGIPVTAADSTAANSGVGGLVGYVRQANLNIEGSHNTGTITLRSSGKHVGLGGLVGMVNDTAPKGVDQAVEVSIKSSYNAGVVSFTRNSVDPITSGTSSNNAGTRNNWQATGGFIGLLFSSNSASNNDAIVSDPTRRIKLEVSGCYNAGLVQCYSYATSDIRATAGGFIGLTGGVGASTSTPAKIKNSYNTGSIRAISWLAQNNQSSTSNAGGMIGFLDSSIFELNSNYNTGDMYSHARVNNSSNNSIAYANCGGIVGDINAACTLTIKNCASSGNLSSTYDPNNASVGKSTYGIGPSANTTHEGNVSTTGTGPGSGSNSTTVQDKINEINDIYKTETLGAVYVKLDTVIKNFTFVPQGQPIIDTKGYKIYKGETFTFTVTPAQGFVIDSVEIDGDDEGAPSGATVANTYAITTNSDMDDEHVINIEIVVTAGKHWLTFYPYVENTEIFERGELSVGASISAPTNFTKTGYNLVGWFEDKEFTIPFDFAINKTMPARNVILYAKWEPLSNIGVTFNANSKNEGGAGSTSATPSVPSKTVTYDATYGNLATISRDGYTFNGWFTAASGGELVTSATKVTRFTAHTLYAQWMAKSDIRATFNTNKGAGSTTPTAPSSTEETVTFDGTYGTLPIISRYGYSFKGWYTATSGGIKIEETTKVTNAANHTLYAQWTAIDITLSFNSQEGTFTSGGENRQVTFDASCGTLPTVTRTGYTFNGWFTSASAGTQMVSGQNVTIINEAEGPNTLKLYAQWTAITSTVTFDVNKGEGSTTPLNPSPATKLVTFDQPYGTLPTISREGYDFKGWYLPETSGVLLTTETKVAKTTNHTLYARWEAKKINITFNAHGGTYTPPSTGALVSLDFDGTYGTLPAISRNGYNFNGWFTAASGGNKVEATTKVTNSSKHELHAQWAAQTFTVTFEKNAATANNPSPASKPVTYDQTYGDLAEISRNGYTFGGWWTAKGTGDDWGDEIESSTNVTTASNHNLYAKWTAKSITISFDANDTVGSTDANSTPTNTPVTFDGTYGAVAELEITRDGYNFLGWSLTRDGALITTETTVNNSANHTLYAKWTAKTNIKVTFIKNDANASNPSATDVNVTFDASYGALPTITYMDSSRSFGGWWTKDGTIDWGSLILPSTIVTNENHDLYARWNEEQSYTITFHTNGGIAVEPISGFATDVVALPDQDTVTKNGYTFYGWYENDGTVGGNWGEKVESVTIFNHDVDLYAKWTPLSNILVTFDKNDGGGRTINATTPSKANMTVTFDSGYGDLATISSDGYNFDGWFTDAIGGTEVTSSTIVTNHNGHKLYAQWTAKTITVTFDKNGATNNPSLATRNVTFDGTYGTLAEITRDGYTFAGWFTSATAGTEVTSATTVTVYAPQILYAQWTARTNIAITFDANDGVGSTKIDETVPPSKNVTFDGVYGVSSTTITRDGYTFDGWSLTRDGALITTETTVTNSADHTLYAQWTAKTIVVTFNGNQGDGSTTPATPSSVNKNVTFDQTYGDLATITRDGYSFVGWFTHETAGDQVTAGTNVTVTSETLNLYAQWTANLVTVSFDVNDTVGSTKINGTAPSSVKVTFDGEYSGLQTLTRNGYDFDGWFTSDGDEIDNGDDVTDFENHTLYAQWTAKTITVTFDKNGATNNPSLATKNVTFDGTYGTLPTITRDGYAFKGWFTSAIDGTEVTASTNVRNFSTHVLYAQWTANTIKVTFNGNKGDGSTTPSNPSITTKDVTFDGKYGNLAEINRDGYTFAGWFTAGGDQITADDNVEVTSATLELYAHWTANSVILVFNTNDTNGSTTANTNPASYDVTFDETYKKDGDLPEITRVGYAFLGWSLTIDGDIITDATVVLNHLTHTLYAQWEAKVVTVTLKINDNANGGVGSTNINETVQSTISVTFDGKYVGLPTISRVGYTFNGWFTLATGGEFVISTSSVLNHENHELHARWTAISYTITFDSRGGTKVNSITENFDTDISGMAPTGLTRIGYKPFDGKWYYEFEGVETLFVFDKMKESLTVYAKWEILPDIKYDILVSAVDSTIDPSDTEYTIDANILKRVFDMQLDDAQFIIWGTGELKQQTGYTFGGYSIISKDDVAYTNLPGIFGQLSDGFLWINMNNIPDEFLHDQGAGNPLIKIYAYYNKEYTIEIKHEGLIDDVEIYVSYWNGQEFQYYNNPTAENRFEAGSDIRIEASQRGNYVLKFYSDRVGGTEIKDVIFDEGGYLFTLSQSVTFWVEAKLAAVTLVKETLTKTANGDIRGSKENAGNYQIDNTTFENVNIGTGSAGVGIDFVTWYLNFNGELIDIINDNRVKSYFVIGEDNKIEKISFSDLRAFKNRSNEIVLIALFSEKVQLNISVSDNAPAGHNKYELFELVDGQWESLGEFSSTNELLAYGGKYRIVPIASKFYNFTKNFEGTELGDNETNDYLEFVLTGDRNITVPFLSKEFTMVVTRTGSGVKGTWSYDEALTFTVGDTFSISFDTASFYKLNKMTIGSKNADAFADYDMVFKNGTLTIEVTVDWLAKAFEEGWLDLTDPASCKFNANIGADTPLSPLVIAGGSIAGAIAIAVIVMITLSVISIRRKKQDYATALVKHREGMARLNQNIVSDLVNG